jgi:hypothetical protein
MRKALRAGSGYKVQGKRYWVKGMGKVELKEEA